MKHVDRKPAAEKPWMSQARQAQPRHLLDRGQEPGGRRESAGAGRTRPGDRGGLAGDDGDVRLDRSGIKARMTE